ncbi:MAG TPA: alpha/beta hydrolase [Candidatus Dormibacteraeota bacterium]|nr:alpha/beta hydrolase [Candidatus Dormibacteraeota bacterium]
MTTHTVGSEAFYLDRPGGRIAYDVAGEGPLVVCVPGMGDLRSVYRHLVPTLVEAGHRAATMDLRGHGDSDATFEAYDDVAAGSDVVALIEELGAPATVIGNSMGAGAAVWAAAEAPSAVSALVLVGPFGRQAPTAPGAGLLFRLALLKPWGPSAWRAWYARLYPGRKPADLDAHRARIDESLRRAGHWRAFVATTHTSHAPVEARLGEVHVPALVVMGGRDPDFRDPSAEAAWIADRLHGRAMVLPEAGHYPQAEYPEVVGPAIRDFLATAEVGRA